MRNIILFIVILISFSCTRKENVTEYINYDSEIFSGVDTLIYGRWEYLYTWSGGGFTGVKTKSDKKLPVINIKPIGNYGLIREENILETGKIDTLGHIYQHFVVQFCQAGIKCQEPDPHIIYTLRSDTLIIGLGKFSDMFDNDFYKRIK